MRPLLEAALVTSEIRKRHSALPGARGSARRVSAYPAPPVVRRLVAGLERVCVNCVRSKNQKVAHSGGEGGERLNRELLQHGVCLGDARIVEPEEELARGDALEVAELVARIAQPSELRVVGRVRLCV